MREIPVLKLDLNAPEKFGNLAEKLDPSERRTLAQDLIELIELDRTSMGAWLGKAKGYLDNVEEKKPSSPDTSEQEGANEGMPPSTEMTLSAVIQFSARATDALLGEPDLARASEPGSEALAAWVSSQLRTYDKNWVLDTDPLAVHMAVTGLAWRKRSYDDDDKVFTSHFLPCTDVIINSNVRSAERAPRITQEFERYPYEIERSIQRGKWVDYEPRFDERDSQAPKRFFEIDCWLDLDGDDIDEPWTIVIARDDTAEVIRIRPRWSAKSIVNDETQLTFNAIRRFYPYRFLPDPKGGFLPIGFGKLLDRTESAADTLLAAIIDTAKSESQNGGVLAGGGFGLPDKVELKENRIATLNTDGRKLSDMFSPFPVKSVSAGSVTVLEKLMMQGDRLAGTLNVLDNAPASMSATMAKGIIDTGTQIQSAVHRRIVASMTQEIHMFVQMASAYDALPEGLTAPNAGAVAVTADPQLATEMQRSALAGIYMQLMSDPFTDAKEVRMRLYRVLRLPDPEKLLGPPPAPKSLDPKDKLNGMIGLMKANTEKMKVIGTIAVNLTQSLKNLVDAGGGMIDQKLALLNMAQLEQVVQQLTEGANNVGSGLEGMASATGDPSPAALPAPAPGGDGAPVLDGAGSGAAAAGAGGGLI